MIPFESTPILFFENDAYILRPSQKNRQPNHYKTSKEKFWNLEKSETAEFFTRLSTKQSCVDQLIEQLTTARQIKQKTFHERPVLLYNRTITNFHSALLSYDLHINGQRFFKGLTQPMRQPATNANNSPYQIKKTAQAQNTLLSISYVTEPIRMRYKNRTYQFAPAHIQADFSINEQNKEITLLKYPYVKNIPYEHFYVFENGDICYNGDRRFQISGFVKEKRYSLENRDRSEQVKITLEHARMVLKNPPHPTVPTAQRMRELTSRVIA
ncbi:MAG: hypothetical protein ACMXYF_00430 [Candidatus Woesearchaeota archaeon]